MSTHESILFKTEVKREEMINEFVTELSFIDVKKKELEPLLVSIPSLPLVDLGAVAMLLEGYEFKLNELVVLLDDATNLVQTTIESKTEKLENPL